MIINIVVELTVLWEEGCEEAAERKKTKYQQLVQGKRVDNMAVYSRGGMLWFPSPICMESADKSRSEGPREKNSCPKVGGSSAKSLLLALAQEGGH